MIRRLMAKRTMLAEALLRLLFLAAQLASGQKASVTRVENIVYSPARTPEYNTTDGGELINKEATKLTDHAGRRFERCKSQACTQKN